MCTKAHSWLSLTLLLCFLLPETGSAALGTWTGFKEEFITADGRVIDRYQQEISHSEGQGYSMLLAVANNDRDTFSLLWEWTKTHLQVRKTDALSAWSWGKRPSGNMAPIDFNNASDGDICIAWALLLAREKWNLPRLQDEAQRIISSIRTSLVLERFETTILLPGYYGFTQPEQVIINPSYLVFPAFQLFAQYDDNVFWQRLYDKSALLLERHGFGRWQLPPDWLALGEDGVNLPDNRSPLFGYEAIRVFLWLSWAPSSLKIPGAALFLELFQSEKKLPATIDLSSDTLSEQEAPAGFYAIAANCARYFNSNTEADALWRLAENKILMEAGNYYSQVLYLLARSRSIP